jgi:DNA-binding transcriptional LysR family regulator
MSLTSWLPYNSRMEYTKLPDLNGWATLCAVVEKGGVTEAARHLHIGQPAVTKRLRALDACYGIALMERVGGRLRLTAAGEKVYLLAVQTMDRLRALNDELAHLAAGQTSMRLEVTSTIGEHLLPDLLLRFSERYPDFKVDSRMTYSRQIQTDLATGLADLALLEIAPDHPDILVQKWMDDELWLVCGAEHPMAGTELIPVEELPNLTYVMREPRSSVTQTLNEALQGIGINHLNVPLEVGSTDTITEILARGRHVSFVPRFAVRERVERGLLSHIKVTGFRIQRTLWIARHRSKLDHPVVEAFIAIVRGGEGG